MFSSIGRFVLLLLLVAVGLPAMAQTGNGSLHGLVTDPSGAAVVGADVQLTGADGATLSAKTAKDGTYQFKNLAPGKYSLKALSKGFSAFELEGLDVVAGQNRKEDVALSIEVEQ